MVSLFILLCSCFLWKFVILINMWQMNVFFFTCLLNTYIYVFILTFFFLIIYHFLYFDIIFRNVFVFYNLLNKLLLVSFIINKLYVYLLAKLYLEFKIIVVVSRWKKKKLGFPSLKVLALPLIAWIHGLSRDLDQLSDRLMGDYHVS